MKWMTKVALILTIIGGVNWGLVGAFNFDLVGALFGEMSLLSRLVYILVGLSGIWMLYSLFIPQKSESK